MDAGQKQAALNAMRGFYKKALYDVRELLLQFGEVSVSNLGILYQNQCPPIEMDDIKLYKL